MKSKVKALAIPMLRVLRRDLLLEISQGQKRTPKDDEIRGWVLEHYRQNPALADVFCDLLLVREDIVLHESELPSYDEAMDLALSLKVKPLPKQSFISVTKSSGETFGILMRPEKLQIGGLVYTVTIFDLLKKLETVIRLEVRACSLEPEPFVSLLTQLDWLIYSRTTANENEYVVLAIQCLAACHQYKYQRIALNKIHLDSRFPAPPNNDVALQLIKDAYLNKIACTKVLVPLARIEPEDVDFALQMSSEAIRGAISFISDTAQPTHELLLYEKNGKLISGDDYAVYLAYRALCLEHVPAVIIGEFNRTDIQIIREGYGELIPPIVVTRGSNAEGKKAVVDKNRRLEDKLALVRPEKTSSAQKYEALYISFARLLADHRTMERDLHRFIAKHPVMVDGHLAAMLSEVPIGAYRADLVLRYEQLDKRVVLIELERHDDRIFKQANRLRDKVNHAVQQVEDWIRAIREGAKPMPLWLDKSYVPEGFVVIGRSKDLTRVQRDTLFNLNSNRVVKVITYDDLLEKMKRLIDMLLIEAR